MAALTPVHFVCHQRLGVFENVLPKVQAALARIGTDKRTWIDKYIVLDRKNDPLFAAPGNFKKVFYCVERDLIRGEFTIHLALRSKKDCPDFAREKRAFALLTDAKGVVQPLLIQTLGRFEYMIAELYNEGDLYTFLTNRVVKPNEYPVQMLSYALVSALLECHARGVIHRDFKLENILVRQLEDDSFDLKITDFGMAFFPGEDPKSEAVHACGSPLYLSSADWNRWIKTGWLLPADYARDASALGYVLFAMERLYLPCEIENSPSGQAIGPIFYTKTHFKLGIFTQEIKELVHGCRTKLPALSLIQKKCALFYCKPIPIANKYRSCRPLTFPKLPQNGKKKIESLKSSWQKPSLLRSNLQTEQSTI